MKTLALTTPDTSGEVLAQRLLEDGCVLLEGLAPEWVTQASRELAPHIELAPYGHTPFLGSHTKRLGGLFEKSEAVQQMAIHPKILGLADAILLPHCARYQLNFSGVMHLESGAGHQPLHRDGSMYPMLHPCPATVMAVMWAANDFTVENGATLVVPGSHLWDGDRKPTRDEIAAAEMPRGSALVYTGGALHGSGSNQTPQVSRTGISVQYSLGWLRQEENQFLTYPPEVAREFPDRLARLVGYDFGGPFLGFVHGGDPHRLIEKNPQDVPDRSNPEVDAAASRIELQQFGSVNTTTKDTKARQASQLNVADLASWNDDREPG
ncbi:MAG: phytanoyl-CoA dioxygenase family protein [Planctomycetaceae bacterium]